MLVKLDDCFSYLGRHFGFKKSDDQHKSELKTVTEKIGLPLHPKNTEALYNILVYVKPVTLETVNLKIFT